MDWLLLTWPPLTVIGAIPCSVAITLLLCRLRASALAAALAGGLFPGCAIVLASVWVFARHPGDDLLVLIGLGLGLLAAVCGLGASAITASLFVGLSGAPADAAGE